MSDVQKKSILAGRISFFEQIANTTELVQNNDEACGNSEDTQSDQDIERIVEDFGQKLKQKRTKEIAANTSSSDNSDSNQLAPNLQKIHEQIDMEDMFGLNDFVKKDEENFIVESYNEPGYELIYTFLEIKSINKCRDSSDGDFVIHEQEYEPYSNPEENDLIYKEDYTIEVLIEESEEEQVDELEEKRVDESDQIEELEEKQEICTNLTKINNESKPKEENLNVYLENKNYDTNEFDLRINQKVEVMESANKIEEIPNQCDKVNKNHCETYNTSSSKTYEFDLSHDQKYEEFNQPQYEKMNREELEKEQRIYANLVKLSNEPKPKEEGQNVYLRNKNRNSYDEFHLSLRKFEESVQQLEQTISAKIQFTPKVSDNDSGEYSSSSPDTPDRSQSQFDENVTDDDLDIGDGYYSESYGPSNILPKNFASEHNNKIKLLRRNMSLVSNKTKLSYILEELVETEDQYSESLRKVVENYIPYINIDIPKHLLGKTGYIFSNIKDIHKASLKLSRELKKSNGDYLKIAQVFLKADKLLCELYPRYSKNKPTSDIYLKEFESIIKKRQKELGDKLDLNSYLLTPIQRLGKYVLLFEGIQKELQKLNKPSESINLVIEKIRKIMRMGNDNIAVDSIKKCPISLTEHGSFVAREKFNLLKPKKMESMVFLFENIIVFTQVSLMNLEQFIYYDSIHVKDLTMASFEEKELIFDLWNYTEKKKNKNLIPFTLEAKTSKIKKNWTKQIQDRLWTQLQQAKETQLRDIQSNSTRNVRRNVSKKIPREVHNSVFYLEDEEE